MPGFLTGMQEGMGGGGGGGGDKDKKNKDQKTSLAQTIGKKIKGAIGIGKSNGGGGSAAAAGGDVGGEANVGGYKRGGKVKRTGLAKVHKGERVLTKKQAKKYSARKR